jgi:ABC-type glycerol-3-phosphate transport system permease component
MAKKAILKRSDRLHTQIFIITWITICVIFTLIPLFVTVINAFKSNREIQISIFALPEAKLLFANIAHNFSIAWENISGAFGRSILVTLIGALVNCILGSVLGYIFTYKKFHFKETIFMMFISIMLLPSIMGMPILVPFMRNTLGLGDTYVGYLLPNLAGGQIGGLFLFRTFFGQQPKSIYESAQIEGANDVNIYCKLTVPLALPIILYKMVGTFSGLYNDYLWPSLIMDSKMTLMPIMLSMQQKFTAGIGTGKQNGAMYAMYIISSIPLIFTSVISMKYFSSGDFAAGIKL